MEIIWSLNFLEIRQKLAQNNLLNKVKELECQGYFLSSICVGAAYPKLSNIRKDPCPCLLTKLVGV